MAKLTRLPSPMPIHLKYFFTRNKNLLRSWIVSGLPKVIGWLAPEAQGFQYELLDLTYFQSFEDALCAVQFRLEPGPGSLLNMAPHILIRNELQHARSPTHSEPHTRCACNSFA